MNWYRLLEEANVAVAYARQLPRKESTLLERYTRQFNYPPESKVKSSKDLEKWESKHSSVRMYVQPITGICI